MIIVPLGFKMLGPSSLDASAGITLYSDNEDDADVLDTRDEEDEYYAIRMKNIPDTCSEKSIVKFFASEDNGEPVRVFLDEDGVLILRSGIRSSQAFVLFKGKDAAKKALLKNFQPIGTSLVHVTDDSVLDAMFKELSVSPRSSSQIRDEDSRRVVLNKLPNKSDKNDLKNFIEPYYIWVSTYGRHFTCRIQQQPEYCDLTVTMVSKLTALFFVMKRNGTNIKLGDEVFPMTIKMHAYSIQADDESSFVHDHNQCLTKLAEKSSCSPNSSENVPTPRPFKLENIVRRFPLYNYKSVIALNNLPADTTKQDIIDIFGEHIAMSSFSITFYPVNETSLTAHIVCPTISQGQMIVNNMRSFDIGSNHVTVHLLCIVEEF